MTARRDAAGPAVDPRIGELRLPAPAGTASVRDRERELESLATGDYLDLTYADTHRWPAPEYALERLAWAASGNGDSYTPYRGDAGVRAEVAENVGRFLGRPVDGERELILTPGTQGAMFAALATFVRPGEPVLLPDPDYLASERSIRFLGGRPIAVPLRWDASPASLDLEVIERAMADGCRLMLFSNPNNPTGAVLPAETLEGLANLVQAYDAFVIVDQLYSRLVYDDTTFVHLSALPGMADRCITLLGPSKTESMSGFRVGVAVGPAHAMDAMEDVQSVTAIRAPAYAQHALVPWLREDAAYVQDRIKGYQALRDQTLDRFAETDVINVVPASGSAYLFPRVALDIDEQEVARALLTSARVLVNPGYQFGPRGAGHFRLCFAQDDAVWDDVLTRMISTLESLR